MRCVAREFLKGFNRLKLFEHFMRGEKLEVVSDYEKKTLAKGGRKQTEPLYTV